MTAAGESPIPSAPAPVTSPTSPRGTVRREQWQLLAVGVATVIVILIVIWDVLIVPAHR